MSSGHISHISHVSIVGDAPLAHALTELSARAGHTVVRIPEAASATARCDLSDLVIVAGDRAAIARMMHRLAATIRADAVVVDATTAAADADQGTEWTALLSTPLLVQGFASVPVDAFVALMDQSATKERADLAVPFAGDDRGAKATVSEFMRQIGVQPFDLGPSTVGYVMDRDGPLWGKALDEIDLRELVGWLSGDG